MKETNKTGLVIAFVVVVALFLLFGGGAMTGATMSGGMMGGISWMLIPVLLIVGLGVLIGGAIWGKK